MEKQDKKIFRTFAEQVDVIAGYLNDAAQGLKDRELRRFLETQSNDLTFLTTDLYDTLNRI